MDYPIKLVNLEDAIAAMSAPEYGDTLSLTGGRKYVYCYTALTTILLGGCVCIDYTGGAAAGQNPRATLPDGTGTIPHQYGHAQSAISAAGGVWVQTHGRCAITKVDGATDVAVGAFLVPTAGAQYLTLDHATVATVAPYAIAETAETVAYGSQAVTTGDPDNTVWLTGALVTL